MSLITLNSNGQDPFFYSTHFPQPIKIEPFSQVCLLKFLHFRDGSVFNITAANNQILFFLGNTNNDAIRIATLEPGQYSGPELATEIARAMNAVCQQQHYNFTCTHTAEDDTTSPPTLESLTIAFASLPQPTAAAVNILDVSQGRTNYISSETANNLFVRYDNRVGFNQGATFNALMDQKGILTHLGRVEMSNIGLDVSFQETGDRDGADNFGFNRNILGIVRNELSDRQNENVNLRFNKNIQDVFIDIDEDGIKMGTVDIAGNTAPGTPGYATRRICREIPSATLRRVITTPGDKDASDIPNLRFRFAINVSGVARRAICEMQVSYDTGQTYIDLDPGLLGNDPQGNPYNASFTDGGVNVFTNAIWVSDNVAYNDVDANGDSLRKQNVIQTKKAPFKPTFNMTGPNDYYGLPDFLEDGLEFITNGASTTPNAQADFSEYTGTNNYDFRLDIDGGPTYFMIAKTKLPPASGGFSLNINEFRVSTADIPYADGTTEDATFNYALQRLTILDGGNNQIITENTATDIDNKSLNDIKPAAQDISINGILNPQDRPLTNMNVADGSKFDTETELAIKHFADFGTNNLSGTEVVNVGADLGRACGLFLRALNVNDIAANSGAPANLKQGQRSGTLGSTIGAVDNFILTASSTGANIFTSQQAVQKVAKDSIIRVAVPEFSGLKSFQGIDQGAGQNLSGVGKDLAVLPKEEFRQIGESIQNSLVYVSPFENWLDINNGQELYLNQLTVEVRQPEGSFATDLRPDSICQLKIRKDPNKQQEQNLYNAFNKAVLQSSSAETTGQILSANIYNKGS
jgi:hypothetical protein